MKFPNLEIPRLQLKDKKSTIYAPKRKNYCLVFVHKMSCNCNYKETESGVEQQ